MHSTFCRLFHSRLFVYVVGLLVLGRGDSEPTVAGSGSGIDEKCFAGKCRSLATARVLFQQQQLQASTADRAASSHDVVSIHRQNLTGRRRRRKKVVVDTPNPTPRPSMPSPERVPVVKLTATAAPTFQNGVVAAVPIATPRPTFVAPAMGGPMGIRAMPIAPPTLRPTIIPTNVDAMSMGGPGGPQGIPARPIAPPTLRPTNLVNWDPQKPSQVDAVPITGGGTMTITANTQSPTSSGRVDVKPLAGAGRREPGLSTGPVTMSPTTGDKYNSIDAFSLTPSPTFPSAYLPVPRETQVVETYKEETETLTIPHTVLKYRVGFETQGLIFTAMFDAGTELPTMKQTIITTSRDEQSGVAIRVLEEAKPGRGGEEQRVLGELVLPGLPGGAKFTPKIAIYLKIDAYGFVHFSAQEASKRDVRIAKTIKQATTEVSDADRLGWEVPMIRMVGSDHLDNRDYWTNSAPFSSKEAQQRSARAHLMARPEWQKTLRCYGMDCKECVGNSTLECWSGFQSCGDIELPVCTSRVLRLPFHNGLVALQVRNSWTRFVNLIHVRCNSNLLEMSVLVGRLLGGTLRLFWDTQEIRSTSSQIEMDKGSYESPIRPSDVSGTFGVTVQARLPAEVKGGHELILEYTLDRDATVGNNAAAASLGEASRNDDDDVAATLKTVAEIQRFDIWMPEEFAQCEDAKVCLQVLAKDLEFRNGNELQLKCLNGTLGSSSPHESICGQWRTCLSDGGHVDRIRTILEAAGVAKPSLQPPAAVATANSSSICMDPLIEDPESWDCDCYDGMKMRCGQVDQVPGYSEELCLRAQFCAHAGVCQHWKSQFCEDMPQALSMAIAEALSQAKNASSLLARRRSGGKRRAESTAANLDDSLGLKQCQ